MCFSPVYMAMVATLKIGSTTIARFYLLWQQLKKMLISHLEHAGL